MGIKFLLIIYRQIWKFVIFNLNFMCARPIYSLIGMQKLPDSILSIVGPIKNGSSQFATCSTHPLTSTQPNSLILAYTGIYRGTMCPWNLNSPYLSAILGHGEIVSCGGSGSFQDLAQLKQEPAGSAVAHFGKHQQQKYRTCRMGSTNREVGGSTWYWLAKSSQDPIFTK